MWGFVFEGTFPWTPKVVPSGLGDPILKMPKVL